MEGQFPSWWLFSERLIVWFIYQISVLYEHDPVDQYWMVSSYYLKPSEPAGFANIPISGTSANDSANMTPLTAPSDTILIAT